MPKLRALFKTEYHPRILLIFPGIVVMLLSMLLSGLAFAYQSGPLAIASMLLSVVWLGILVLIALPQTDVRLARAEKWLRPLSKTLMIALLAVGVVELAALAVTSLGVSGNGILGDSTPKFMKTIPHDIAYSDSDALLYQAVDNLLAGKNPYENANVVIAVQALKSPTDKITPLRAGPLEDTFPYPTPEQYAQIWQEALQSPTQSSPAIESALGYPAGFFLIPAVFISLGITNLRLILLLLTLPAMAYAVYICKPELRLWLSGAFLGSLVIWNGIASGLTSALYFPFLLLAWVLWKRNLWLSALFMGVAIATKQQAWFFLPFYLILVWRNVSFTQALKTAGAAGGVFLALNLPFIASNPRVWLDSVLSLLKDPLFPSGTGPVTLVTFGYLRIESSLMFLIAEVIVMLAGLVWYWFNARRYPAMGIVLAVLPIFFAWRSLWPYFFYVDVILLAMVMINEYSAPVKQRSETSAG